MFCRANVKAVVKPSHQNWGSPEARKWSESAVLGASTPIVTRMPPVPKNAKMTATVI